MHHGRLFFSGSGSAKREPYQLTTAPRPPLRRSPMSQRTVHAALLGLLAAIRAHAQPDLAALCTENPGAAKLFEGTYWNGNSTVGHWDKPAGAACRWSADGDPTEITTL